jgi:uncharacterized OB-fold protein
MKRWLDELRKNERGSRSDKSDKSPKRYPFKRAYAYLENGVVPVRCSKCKREYFSFPNKKQCAYCGAELIAQKGVAL